MPQAGQSVGFGSWSPANAFVKVFQGWTHIHCERCEMLSCFSLSTWTLTAALTDDRILFLMTEQRCQNISVAPLGTSATSLASIFTAGHNFIFEC